MKKVILTTCAAVAVSAGAALAQSTPIELRFAHWVPATHPIHEHGMTEWAESIAEASDGSITVAFFPAQQLGQAGDHYDMARDGVADIAFVSPGYQPGRFPIVTVGNLPFMFANATGGSRALDEWYRPYAEREMSDVKVCLIHMHAPGTLHSRTPVRVPSDVSGMNVRPAHAEMASFISLLGGQNFQVTAPEARDALDRGIADAITFPWNSIILFGIDGAVNYHLDMPLYATTFAWAMNQSTYDQMSEEQQRVIDDHCTSEWAERVSVGWSEVEVSGREKLLGMDGHEAIVPEDDDIEAWREAAQPLTESWMEGVRDVYADLDPEELLENLRALIDERGASY